MAKVIYLDGDLPAGAKIKGAVAIDTEATGLSALRDRLCVVQLKGEGGDTYVVRVEAPYRCPNLKKILADPTREHIFHFARFDIMMIKKCLGVDVPNIFCTRTASKLVRTYSDKHSLKTLVLELLGIEMDKTEQNSDWAAKKLSAAQINYAAGDVQYLHQLRAILGDMLKREGREKLAKACFAFIPHRAELDIAGWETVDIFAH